MQVSAKKLSLKERENREVEAEARDDQDATAGLLSVRASSSPQV